MKTSLPRWMPTGTPALIAGLVASGVSFGLHALGVTPGPNVVSEAVTPLVGFLVASIVQKPNMVEVESEAKAVEESTLGKLIGQSIEKRIDTIPQAEQDIVKAAISVLNAPIADAPPVVPPKVAVVIAQAVADNKPLVEPEPSFLTAPSTEAPHVTE